MHLVRPPVWNVSPGLVHPKWRRLWSKALLAVAHDGSPIVANHATKRSGAIVGTVARRSLPYIGVGQDTAGGGKHGLNWPIEKVAFSKATFAAVLQVDSVAATQVFLATDDGNTGGLRVSIAAGGALQATATGVGAVSTGITLSANTPYFIGMALDAKRDTLLSVVRNLATGAIQTASAAFSPTPVAGTTGLASFGYGRATVESVDGVMAMGFITADAVSLATLQDWALDPWGPFRLWDESRVTYAAGGAQSYTYTPSGGITYSGIATTVRTETKPVSGGIALAGTSAQMRGREVTPTGGVSFSGTAAMFRGIVRSITGGLVFSGSAPVSFQSFVQSLTVTPVGGLVITGSAAVVRSCTRAVSGGIALAGTAATEFGNAFTSISNWLINARRRGRR
jgi:hypothetical protein